MGFFAIFNNSDGKNLQKMSKNLIESQKKLKNLIESQKMVKNLQDSQRFFVIEWDSLPFFVIMTLITTEHVEKS